MLGYSVDHGLFDLHWFERCPTIAVARATGEGARLRAMVKQRADAIHDALFCDHPHAHDSMATLAD
jgi:hypothetical protein